MKFINIISLAGLLLPRCLAEEVGVADVAATVNGPCTGAGGAPGVCIATAACTKGGGKFISNACPGTPTDIKCCSKAACGSGGRCQFENTCTNGNILSNLCPGPAAFKCCESKSGGEGGGDGHYPAPKYPKNPPCQAVTIAGTKKILAKFPGAVRELFCMRGCACNAKPLSDHCCGLAMDLMCSRAGGVKTEAGRPIAEWVAQNHASLKLKYVIWGQKIWQPSIDKYKPWTQWKQMENRGSTTANHWDHVHVSFNR